MPAVYVELVLFGKRELELRGLLNSGAEGLELVVPVSIAKKLELKKTGKAEVVLGGRRYLGDAFKVRTLVTAGRKKRSAKLRCISLPNGVIDCVLLGTEAQAKLGVIPDTTVGEPLFKPRP